MIRWPSKSYEKFCAIVQGRRRDRRRKGKRKKGGRETGMQKDTDTNRARQDYIVYAHFCSPLASVGFFRTKATYTNVYWVSSLMLTDTEDILTSTHNGHVFDQSQLSFGQLWLPLWTMSTKKASSL